MITHISGLGRAWAAVYGPPPDDYLVVDIETTGRSVDYDYITQIGWCRVVNRLSVFRGSAVFDWSKYLAPAELVHLESRLRSTIAHMYQKSGVEYKWTPERLKTDGLHPEKAILAFLSQLSCAPVLVGHNAWKFDLPFIELAAYKLTGKPAAIPPTRVIDTMAMVKGAQTGTFPQKNEDYRSYALRAIAAGGNKYLCSLDRFCVPTFGLDVKFGVDVAAAHDAEYDAWMTHLVFEELRKHMFESAKVG